MTGCTYEIRTSLYNCLVFYIADNGVIKQTALFLGRFVDRVIILSRHISGGMLI